MVETIADAWRNEGLEKGLEKGRLEGSRGVLLKQIARRFPQRSADEILQRLEAISEVQALEILGERLVAVDLSWDELWA